MSDNNASNRPDVVVIIGDGNVVSSRAIPQGRLCRNATHGLVRTILATLPLGLAVGNMLV